eukprot:NODE_468_length_7060_cov_0.310157.p8 type:complete len:114 gc:universal NODE_468_length_7060_cov_0.310157:2252-1911(-)
MKTLPVNRSCGNDFLQGFQVNTQIFSGSDQNDAKSLNLGLIIGLSIGSFILLIIAVIGCVKYCKQRRRFFTPLNRQDSARLSVPVIDQQSFNKSKSSEIKSREMDEYYVSKPL